MQIKPLANNSIDQLASQVYIIPFNQDPLAKLTELLVTDSSNSLPDLCHVTVLLPDASNAARCRKLLLKQANKYGYQGLLGPNIKTLQSWAIEISIDKSQVISDHARELILVEALLEHPELYGKGSPWLLANSLLELFNQLTRNHVKLPDSLEEFTRILGKAYGINDQFVASLSKEANIVYTLWHAMQTQLKDQQQLDRETAHSLGLNQLSQSLTNSNSIYIAGYTSFTRAEKDWINSIAKNLLLKIITHGHASEVTMPELEKIDSTTSISLFTQELLSNINLPISFDNKADPYSKCIDTIFSSDKESLIERSSKILRQYDSSPIQDNINIYLASGAENEARAIDLQIRIWLLAGHSNIAIVTDNRRLARRVRAILERSGILIRDSAGWALSTTSASTTVERLLQVVEEDFHFLPLLDLLKSPFIFPDMDRQHLLETIYRFEQGIIVHENIASGLHRYFDNIAYRKNKLPPEMASYYDDIPPLLMSLEKSLDKLKNLLNGQHPPVEYIESLLETLEHLGITTSLNADDAGNRIVTEINLMAAACQYANLEIDWLNFRIWLGETLERFNFRPTDNNCSVQLLNLSQSSLNDFDGVIIAGMEKEFLPGFHSNSPFFNDEVRASLGLGTQKQYQLMRFYQFRQLLESSSGPQDAKKYQKILLTARKREGDEEIPLSPWLEAIQSFHAQTYGNSLNAANLGHLLESAAVELTISSHEPLPQKSDNPKVRVDASLIPTSISASGYQQLLDCPYQFYAARCLKLSPQEGVQKFLAKSDYGERVHHCLLAFHKKSGNLPGPFPERITELNQEKATLLLENISKKIFSTDIEDNFIHRGWLKMWLNIIPRYINWQINQANSWEIHKLEEQIENIKISPYINIGGIIDRIDINQNNLCVIDYKTGMTPDSESVLSGEAIQLPFYALIADTQLSHQRAVKTNEVHYLSLSQDKFGLKISLNEEDLADLKPRVSKRLTDIFNDIHNGQALPAWGDSSTCSRCSMDGLCRKQVWRTTNAHTNI